MDSQNRFAGRSVAFQITITEEAETHLLALPARDQRILETAIESRLTQQPTTPTRSIKRLRPNPFAEFEIRVGDLRILYNVEGEEVILLLVGRKAGNKLIVGGKEFHGHQDDPPESTGSRSGADPL